MTSDMLPTEDAPIDTSTPARRHNWVSVLVTLVGGVLILGLVLQALLVGVTTGGGQERSSYSVDVDGVTRLDLDASAGDLTVTFAPVAEATLEVQSAGRTRTDWTLEVDGDRLIVREGNPWWILLPDFGTSRTTAELVLPDILEGAVSADLEVSAGSMDIQGDLTDVRLDVSAGSLTFHGTSTSLVSEVSAGEATVVTNGPSTIDVSVSAGRFTGTVTGAQPDRTQVEVSAGDVILDLPDGAYATSGSASAGDRLIEVRTDPDSPHLLEVHVSAGDARIGYSS